MSARWRLHTGPKVIAFTARPTLLALGGTSFVNNVALDYQSTAGCVFAALHASGATTITVVPPSKDPLSQGYWSTHPTEWTSEIRARVQATDQRYDGRDGSASNGALSAAEVTAMFASGGNFPNSLEQQLLGTYLNLATRRINAGTAIASKTSTKLGLANVRGAALYATGTLLLPVTSATRAQYTDINAVLEDINQNKIEKY